MIEGNNLIKRANELNQSYYKLKEVTQRVLAIAIEQAQDIERQTGENLILMGLKWLCVLATTQKFTELI